MKKLCSPSKPERRPRQHRQRRLGQPHRFEHLPAILLGQLRELRLELGAHRHDLAALGLGPLADRLHQRPLAGEVGLVHVGHVQHRLGGQEAELLERELIVLVHAVGEGPNGLALVEGGEELFEQGDAGLGLLVAALGGPLGLGQGDLGRLQVGEHELGVDGFDVRKGLDLAFDVGDVVGVGLEASDDVEDGVDLADVGEELVAQPSPSEAPRTMPAMSTRRSEAGTTFCVGMCSVMASSRGSGTATTPTLGSMVQKG